MTILVTREFKHRDDSEALGKLRLRVKDGKFEMALNDGEFAELPQASIEYLLTFSLQSCQDAYAGAANADERKNAFEAKAAKIIDGTVSQRGGGARVDAWTAAARDVIRLLLKGNADALAAYKACENAEERNAFLDEKIKANESNDAFKAHVDKLVKAKAPTIEIKL